jgi:internalin A
VAAASEGEKIALERISKEADERTGFLDLGKLGLTELPAGLFELKHLRSLNLGRVWREASGQWQVVATDLGRNQVAPALQKLADLSDLRELWLRETDLANLSILAGLSGILCAGP